MTGEQQPQFALPDFKPMWAKLFAEIDRRIDQAQQPVLARIEQQEGRIAELEARLTALESRLLA